MEQQPGPVNWAPHNPEPHPGMVRFWTWEAFAHGAEAVCYFRWRQAPMAQEQMHAGMLRPDGVAAPAFHEAKQVAGELRDAGNVENVSAPVAIVFDYDADAAWQVQPHGEDLSYFGLVFGLYRAMRSLGLSIDIIPPTTRDFAGYRLVAVPGMMHVPDDLMQALVKSDSEVLFGPRTGARDCDMRIPIPLPPNIPNLDVTVSRVESLRPDMAIDLEGCGQIEGYREVLEGTASMGLVTRTGSTVSMSDGKLSYVGAWLDLDGWKRVIELACERTGLDIIQLPNAVRVRETGAEQFWFNHDDVEHVVNGKTLAPLSVTRQEKPISEREA